MSFGHCKLLYNLDHTMWVMVVSWNIQIPDRKKDNDEPYVINKIHQKHKTKNNKMKMFRINEKQRFKFLLTNRIDLNGILKIGMTWTCMIIEFV